MADPTLMLRRAGDIADQVLFPAALTVDRTGILPPEHLDRLADEGFYGVATPAADGGLGFENFATMAVILETLASGCLTTAFVWLQHHSSVLHAVRSTSLGNREKWIADLSTGRRRGGVGLAGLRSPEPLTVRRDAGDFVLSGRVPWVTGWGLTDTVLLAAKDADDLVHFLLVDAEARPTLAVREQQMLAVQASRTVTVDFDRHRVPAARLASVLPFAEWSTGERFGSALNGFLAVGVAARCCRLLGDSPLDAEVSGARAALLAAEGDAVPRARANASQLAYRAAAALVVQGGSRSILPDAQAQRLMREATFLLVFGSRPSIKAALLDRLTQPVTEG